MPWKKVEHFQQVCWNSFPWWLFRAVRPQVGLRCIVFYWRGFLRSKMWGGWAQAYNEALGRSPQWSPGADPCRRGRGEVRGWSPRVWKPFTLWMPNWSSKFASFSVFCILASQAPNVTDPLPSKPRKNSPDFHHIQEQPLAKVGWSCPPRGDAPVLLYWLHDEDHA